METFDKQTLDSTGAFYVGELERLDQTLHLPLVNYTWSRDIDLREDVSMADETSSYTNSTFAAPGGINPTGKNWIGKAGNAIPGIGVDIGKTANPLYPWGLELGYTILELASAQKMGRPIDEQKYQGMQLKWNMDVDEMVYIGDSSFSKYGLLNHNTVTAGFVSANAAGTYLDWAHKTAEEIKDDINALLTAVYARSGYAVCPDKLLIPPTQFGLLLSRVVSTAGSESILAFIKRNSYCNEINGKPLDIKPCKWCISRGVAAGSPSTATDRMVAYSQNKMYVRFPMVPLQRTPMEYRSLAMLVTYYGRLGCVEFVYANTAGYSDGI